MPSPRGASSTTTPLPPDGQAVDGGAQHIELDGALDQRRRSGERRYDVQVGPAGERGGHSHRRRPAARFIPSLPDIVFRLFMSPLVVAALTQKSSDVRHLQAKCRAHSRGAGMTSTAAPRVPAAPRLRRNAVGLTGAVIMSAAIMGPAVSTFFNPQFSTPFSGAATPFVYLVCLIAILIAASGIVEMARELPSAGAFYTYVTRGLGPRAGFVTGGLMFVAYALLPPAEVGLIGSYLQSYVPRRVRFEYPVVDHRAGARGADDAARVRGHPLLAARGADPVHARGARGRGAGVDRRRPGRPGRADARTAQSVGLAERLQRAHHRVRVRRAELRRLRGRGHARRRGHASRAGSSRAPCSSASCSSG